MITVQVPWLTSQSMASICFPVRWHNRWFWIINLVRCGQLLSSNLVYCLVLSFVDPWRRAFAEMHNLSPLSASSDPDGDGIVGVTVELRLSAQSTVHSRYLTMYSLQRTQRDTPRLFRKGELWCFFFWVLSLSLSELSLSPFSCSFQYHLIFDCDISIVNSIHVLVFLYLGGQLDKLCFSVRPPSRNELHTDCKLYHILLLGR